MTSLDYDMFTEIYLLMLMGITCCATAVSVFVLYCHHHPGTTPPPALLRMLAPRGKGTSISSPTPLYDDGDHGNQLQLKEATNETGHPVTQLDTTSTADLWRDVASAIDKYFFWLFFVSFSLTAVICLGIIPSTIKSSF